MQSVAGNQAVSRIVGASRQAALQRYVVVPTKKQKAGYWQGENAPLRVSDDGSMAVKHANGTPSDTKDFQVFYALPAVIQQSATALAQTGSAFTIAPGAGTIVGSAPGRRKAPQQTLNKAVISNQDLARIGKSDFTFNACSANLNNFLGVLRSEPNNALRLEQRRDVVTRLEGSLDHDKKSINVGEDLSIAMVEARKVATGSDASKKAYDGMKESMRKQVAAQYGIDEAALPDVGEGFGIMQSGKGGKQGMGHFAPVVAKSGGDRVTLENDVSQVQGREKQPNGEINPNWYMRMFGTEKKQTFWGEAQKHEQGEYGDRPFVATIGSHARQQDHDD